MNRHWTSPRALPDRSAGDAPVEMRLIAVPGLPEIAPGDDLAGTLAEAIVHSGTRLQDGDVVVIAQKIVSKAEDQFIDLDAVEMTEEAEELAGRTGKDARQVQAVLDQSNAVLRARPGVIVVEDKRGFVLANAGLDASNVGREGDHLLALPDNPDASAARLRSDLEGRFGVRIGVVINDSWGRPFRLGTVGVAIGVAGIAGLEDRCGSCDRDGRILQGTHVAVADELAAAASLLMGAGAEGRPVVIVRGSGVASCEHGSGRALLREPQLDMFREEQP